MTPHPSRLCRWRTDQRSSFSFFAVSSSFSPRVLRSPTDSLALRRVLRCGILCSPVFSLCSYPSISPPVSLLRYGMVGTVAGDGAPRSLSVVRSSGVCWTRPFSFSDSSLVGPRPFSLPLFHPARALCVVFVALSCHVRCWLGFYLTWQFMTTVSPLLASRQPNFFTTTYAPRQFSPSSTGWAYLSQFIRFSVLVKFQTLQHLPTSGTNVAFPFGRLTCVLSALPTSPWSIRPRNRLHPPAPALSGRLLCGWCLLFVCFKNVAFAETLFQWICDFLLSLRWQKGDRPDNDFRWAMQHPEKKKAFSRRTHVCQSLFAPCALDRQNILAWAYNRHLQMVGQLTVSFHTADNRTYLGLMLHERPGPDWAEVDRLPWALDRTLTLSARILLEKGTTGLEELCHKAAWGLLGLLFEASRFLHFTCSYKLIKLTDHKTIWWPSEPRARTVWVKKN